MKTLLQICASATVIGIICLIISHEYTSHHASKTKEKVYIYNWGEYIDPSLIHKFEKQTGIKVIYETFDSNEAMEAKIRNGGTHYDVAFPSDYTVEKMKKEQLLHTIDHKKLSNYCNLDRAYLNQDFDKGNRYSIPYFFGTVGILYNKEQYADINFNSWASLNQPQLRNDILLVDGAREVMGMALNKLGFSLNDTNEDHLNKAQSELSRLAPQIRGVVGDEVSLMMSHHEANVAVVWSGVALPLVEDNPNFDYVVPEEGSNMWLDNMVIPKTAQNKEGAYRFINFLLDEENSKQNTEWVGYATPNKAARAQLPAHIRNDKSFYPTQAQQRSLEVYRDLGQQKLGEYNDRFLEFKMNLR
ncbi:ABC transporter substrate-binding protein [Staphylococcus sp. SQ8-PEA]|uniref:ABC transporter substrate-binding protein n=1 Tax=Staphylococcus marylandisciuri TaxID=2981529 RepID=A0ABT2QNW8_9STAP|nr:ABC transporter substrate-binding protein [Staphylococcus marylandisciuri]MCU5745652.1 ABC transporter substrate-binding protein [Staphylococcus marylandisciuri]